MEEVEEINIHKGYIGVVKPGQMDIEYIDFEYDTSDEGRNKALIKLIEVITGKKDGKITNSGYLPNPFQDFTMFMDFEQFDNDAEYNVGFFGNPVFGNLVFLLVDRESEEGTIYPIPEDKKEYLAKLVKNLKKFEMDSGIYMSMKQTDKNKFLEEFVKEQNNILNESTKDIKGENSEELEKVKEELNTVEKKYHVVRIDYDTDNKEGEVIESFLTREEAFDFIDSKSKILNLCSDEVKEKVKMEGSQVGESPENSVYYKIIKD